MKTRLNFKISYPYFLFYLVENFSCWDVHCRNHLKERLPEFYALVAEYLPPFANIRKTKYGWKTIEKFFLYETILDVEKNIHQNLPSDEAEIVLAPVRKLADNISVEKYWENNLPFITRYADLLGCLWERWMELARRDIESFFEVEMPPEISIFVVPSERSLGGGCNLSGKGITLEIGSTNVTPGNILEVIMHEIIHYVSNSKTIRLLNENGAQDAPIIEEAIVGTLASNSGLLSSKIKLSKGNVISLPREVEDYRQKIKEAIADRLEKKNESYEVFIKRIAEQLKA